MNVEKLTNNKKLRVTFQKQQTKRKTFWPHFMPSTLILVSKNQKIRSDEAFKLSPKIPFFNDFLCSIHNFRYRSSDGSKLSDIEGTGPLGLIKEDRTSLRFSMVVPFSPI